MNLLIFKYIRVGRLIFLLTLLTLSSTLFSITCLSLLGFYSSFSSMLDVGGNVLTVYGRGSSTPFTGLVPAQISNILSNVSGVLASSPEVLAPCVLDGKPVFLRAVIPEYFLKIQPVKVVEGEMFEFSQLDSACVGFRLAKLMGLRVGERILVQSILVDRYVELHVVGVIESNSPLDDEILAPLYVGQWLRGSDYAHATLVRLKVDRSRLNISKIYQVLGVEASSETLSTVTSILKPLPHTLAHFRVEDVGIEYAGSFMEGYLERYGLTKDTILALSMAVFLFSSASVIFACETVLAQHSRELEILKSLGASRRLLKRDIMLKLMPLSFAASLLGMLLAFSFIKLIQNHILLLSHTIQFTLDTAAVALNFILLLALIAFSVWKAEL
ncbi:MAG: ABC transporter permease [Nitrososphaeria archaeon]|nr:ABC transporter permease [Nitrososphaeria archaeon]